MRTTLVALVCIVLLFGTLAGAQSNPAKTCPSAGFDARPWLEDFSQLTTEMAAHYSDLEFAVEERHMDLPSLRMATETKLSASCDEQEARRVMESFFNSFGDGHLEIDWPQPGAQAADVKADKTGSLCTRLGYKKSVSRPGIDFSRLPQFSGVGGDGAEWFPGGILRLDDHAKLGVIRIATFSEHAFPDACEQVLRNMQPVDPDKCGTKCKNKIQRGTGDLLTAAIVGRSALLQSAGATAILVDLSHNEGGSEWVDAVVRSLSNKPLRESPYGFIKHELWTKELEERLAEVKDDLKNGKEPQFLLQQASALLQSAIARSQDKCDRDSIWTDGKPTCSLVVSGLIYSSGVLAYAEPGSFTKLASKGTLFQPLDYRYDESGARPPLYVVVDAETWSAAEYFAFLLQDNHAGTILGEVTGGAGCGFTNGGIPTTLKNTHAMVKMPDCVHFRADGSNANAGVTPDIFVPWSGHDNSFLRAQKLFRSLANVIATKPKEASQDAH